MAKNHYKKNYPQALGAIDGKHVVIKKSPENECLWADFGCNGRTNDSGVWNKSALHRGIEIGSIQLPQSKSLTENYPK